MTQFDSAATRDALRQEYSMGFNAYLDNQPLCMNPHWPDNRMQSKLYDEWCRGWVDARLQDKRPFRRLTG